MKPGSGILIFAIILVIQVNLSAQYSFNVIRSFSETSHEIVFASFNSDGEYIITGGTDSSIIIWSSGRRTIYRTLTGLNGRPNAAVMAPDNKLLFSGGRDNKVTIWDFPAMPPKIIRTLDGFSSPVRSLDISPDGKYLATGSSGGSVKIWDPESGSIMFDLKAGSKNRDINCVKFSPDGKILAAGGADGMLTLWNTANGLLAGSLAGQKNGIQQIRISPDSKLLAICGYSNEIILCRLPGLDNRVLLKGHKDWVQSIAFSPDGKNLISGGRDGYIILWDPSSGNITHRSDNQGKIVLAVDFNPLQPSFISAYFKSAGIDEWALSGTDEAQWKRTTFKNTASLKQNISQPEIIQKPPAESAQGIGQQAGGTDKNSVIEIFSPVPEGGRTTHDKNSILIVGRVSDPQGINTFLINKNSVKLSEGGVFQYNLNLLKGENQVDLIAINNRGILNEKKFIISCTAENAGEAGNDIPEIAKSKYYALIMGVSEYQSDDISDLDNPVKDAQSLYDVLTTRYNFDRKNVTFLKNPTQKEMFIAFENMGKILTPDDNFLIFYAGHGNWEEKSKLGYWLPSDATRNSKINWFSNSNLRDFIGSIEAKHTILIADACFSGAIFKSRSAFTEVPRGIQKLYELQSRKAMTSGILQEVPDESQFIKYLVRRLIENEEKYLPSEILFSTFKASVMNNSSTVPQYGVIQNVGDDGGDFIFVKR